MSVVFVAFEKKNSKIVIRSISKIVMMVLNYIFELVVNLWRFIESLTQYVFIYIFLRNNVSEMGILRKYSFVSKWDRMRNLILS